MEEYCDDKDYPPTNPMKNKTRMQNPNVLLEATICPIVAPGWS